MIALATTNNMLRSLGLNVPPHDDRIFDPDFGYLADYHLEHTEEPTVMDAAGWHDEMGTDMFTNLPFDAQITYAQGMGFDFDA